MGKTNKNNNLSFKLGLNDRKITVELEFEEKKINVVFCAASVSVAYNAENILDVLKSMLRKNENALELFKEISDNISAEQLVEILQAVSTELTMEKK